MSIRKPQSVRLQASYLAPSVEDNVPLGRFRSPRETARAPPDFFISLEAQAYQLGDVPRGVLSEVLKGVLEESFSSSKPVLEVLSEHDNDYPPLDQRFRHNDTDRLGKPCIN